MSHLYVGTLGQGYKPGKPTMGKSYQIDPGSCRWQTVSTSWSGFCPSISFYVGDKHWVRL